MRARKRFISGILTAALLMSQQGFFVWDAVAATIVAPCAGAPVVGNGAAGTATTGGVRRIQLKTRGSYGTKVGLAPSLKSLVTPGIVLPSVETLPGIITPVSERFRIPGPNRTGVWSVSVQGGRGASLRAVKTSPDALPTGVVVHDVGENTAVASGINGSTPRRSIDKKESSAARPSALTRKVTRLGRKILSAPKRYFDQSAARRRLGKPVKTAGLPGVVSRNLLRKSAQEDPDFTGGQMGVDAYSRMRELKAVLADGTQDNQDAFWFFRPPSGRALRARAKGLEGFLYSKLEFERDNGVENTLSQLGDYFGYLEMLLKSVAWTGELRARLKALQGEPIGAREKNLKLNELLGLTVRRLRSELKTLDGGLWGRGAAVYLIFARGYNRLKDGKKFFDSLDNEELDRIKRETGSNVIWVMDMFEIGVVNRWGDAGGSPYALRNYHVKPELGGDASYRDFVKRARAKGLAVKNIADYVVNHTSIDSDMVRDLPEGLIHMVPPQRAPGEDLGRYEERILREVPRDHAGIPVYKLVETDNYPEGGKRVHKHILLHHPMQRGGFPFLYIDMAQIDYSLPAARAYRIKEIVEAYKRLDLNGLRRDLAYFVLNDKFFDLWLGNLRWEKGRAGKGWFKANTERMIAELKHRRRKVKGKEFLEEMTRAIYAVDPKAFIFDEAYERFEELSRSGSHAYYDKMGFYDALKSRNADHVRAALREIAYRTWQLGGAGLLHFIGTHDGGEGNPVETFGRQYRAAAALSLLLRPTLFYNGTELGTGRDRFLISDDLDRSEDHHSSMKKMIPFDVKAWINWANTDSGKAMFLRSVLEAAGRNQELFQQGAMEVLRPTAGTPLVAYSAARRAADGSQKALIVAGNLADGEAQAVFKFDRPVLESFGAFLPRADRSYVLRDQVRHGGGEQLVVTISGKLLREHGLFIRLGGGDAHVFEVEEVDPNAPTTGPPGVLSAAGRFLSQGRESAVGEEASDEPAEEAANVDKETGLWSRLRNFRSATWDDWTEILTNGAILAFLPLQVPQIIKNFGYIFAGTLNPISILPWMGYSTGILANMLLLSYFVGEKEAGAARVQAIGVLSSAFVVTQIFFAGFMPAIAFWIIVPTIVTGLILNYLNFQGIVNGVVWKIWNGLLGLGGLVVLPMAFWATFGTGMNYWPAIIAAVGGSAFLILRELDRLPNSVKNAWGKLSAWAATLLFMFGPIAQLASNFGNPVNIAGISLFTILLAVAGNALMLPRAVLTKDRIWFTGSFWAVGVGGWVVMLSMLMYNAVSPVLFMGFSLFLPLYMAFMFWRAKKHHSESFLDSLRFLWSGKKKG